MKIYTVILVQLILWSGYTFLEWLSKHDHPIYNVLMFLVFFYLAIIAGNFFMNSTKNDACYFNKSCIVWHISNYDVLVKYIKQIKYVL